MGRGGKSAPTKKRNYALQLHNFNPRTYFLVYYIFPLDPIAINAYFGFGENPTELYREEADLPRLEKQKIVRCMMKLRAIISPCSFSLHISKNWQLLLLLLSWPMLQCYVMFYACLNTLDNSARGRFSNKNIKKVFVANLPPTIQFS